MTEPVTPETVKKVDVPLPEEKKHWLVRQTTIKYMWWVGGAFLVIVTLLDFTLHPHPYFGVDGWKTFYSVYGFIACAAMVFGAKGLGYILKRKDTYYDD